MGHIDSEDTGGDTSKHAEWCGLCQKHDDLRQGGAKAYSRCDIRDGQPCTHCVEYVQLEAKIEEAKANLEKMLTQHRQMRTAINETHDPILRRVPREVASLIFQFAIPNTWSLSTIEQNFRTISYFEDKVSSPLILGAVCKAWRELIWDTPRLWTFVQLKLEGPYHEDSSEQQWTIDRTKAMKLSVFPQWLSRAGQLPLSVYIHIESYPTIENSEYADSLLDVHFSPFFDILNNYSHRLRDLAIVSPPALISYFDGGSRGAPLLRRLALSIDPSNWDFDVYKVKFRLKTGMPQLDFVSLDEYRFKDMLIDWNYVTTLVVQSLTIDECFDVLRTATELKFCRFKDIETATEDYHPPAPIFHKKLEGLELTGSWRYTAIIEGLTLPTLKHLTIGDVDEYTSLLDFMTRSLCALNTLRIDSDEAFQPFEDLAKLLEMQPSIENLTLYPYEDDFDFLRLLAYRAPTSSDKPDHHRPLLPNLRSLSLRAPVQSFSAEAQREAFQFSTTFWDLVSGIFAPVLERRRLLDTLKIDPSCYEVENMDLPSFLNKNVSKAILKRLIDIHDAGVTLELPHKVSREDLVRVWTQKDDLVVGEGDEINKMTTESSLM